MPVSRTGTLVTSMVTPTSPRSAISADEEVSPAAPMSWIATMCPLLINSRLACGRKIFGSKRCPVDSVSPGLCSDSDDWIAHALGLCANQIALVHQPDAHRVDKRVSFVRFVEH